jgi:deoxyribonuclease V
MTISNYMDFAEYFYSLVKQIPKGNVSTYGALAKALGDIRASRAVGRMLNQNPYAPIVPCHRVVMGDGKLGGFGTGVENKIALLKLEGVSVSKGEIVDFSEVLFTDFNSDFPLLNMRKEQKKLKNRVKLEDGFSQVKTIAGVDVAYSDSAYGACVVYDYKTMEIIEKKVVQKKIEFPYIPTYLGFREIPMISDLIKNLENKPTVLLVDGNGVLHPYGLGIASHVGVRLNIPTIGCAKSKLCGEIKGKLNNTGDCAEIEFEKSVVGYAYLSSSRSKKPIYISPGHKVSFETTFDVIKNLCNYKIPEPLRLAHIAATEMRNKNKK